MVASSADQAVKNARAVSSYDVGMCQKYVRDQCWRVGSLYASAIDAWNGSTQKHPGDRTPPLGAPMYYRGGQYGHAVIWRGGGIRSTDCTSTGRVSDAEISWIEQHWGYTYLGWTGDINGVDLPLGSDAEEDDDMKQEDEISEWSPDDGGTGKTTVGKTLNQARGYSEDTYERVKALEKVVDKIAKAVGVK